MTSNPRCWANVLDDCEGLIEGEHIISLNAFQASGHDRSSRERHNVTAISPRRTYRTRLAKLTSNMLCARHNRATSCLDDAAGQLVRSLHDIVKLTHSRWTSRLPWAPWVRTLDGSLIERWLIKTAINCWHTGNFGLPIGGPQAPPNWPTPELVEQVFGIRSPVLFEGLWAPREPVSTVTNGDTFMLDFSPNITSSHIAGCLFSIAGYPLAINFGQHPILPEYVAGVPDWDGHTPVRRLSKIGVTDRNLAIEFKWPARQMPIIDARTSPISRR